ncbi:MAG: recombinase family protein [Lachnospiraceae bacterium]|nr:recombinase family protein [Lachnospiraceae bacterium]
MVAIYPRQSLFKKDSLSIDQQIERCVHLCESNGWEYRIYDKDRGYSGKDLNRPSFQEMMADVRAGLVEKIVCYKLDRISRNISDFSQLLIELQKYHCEFVSISESFDTSSPIGRAMVYICMVFAQMERETISGRVLDNYYYRTKLGFWGGGVAPYGYRLARMEYQGKKHTILEPDPDAAEVVRNIYQWYLDPNGSASRILEKLNGELKIPSRTGSQWTSRVLMDILSKPLYAPNDMAMYHYLKTEGADIINDPVEFDGRLSIDLYGKKDKELSKHKRCRSASEMYCNVSYHEAIVDSDLWIRVQNKRKMLLHKPGRSGTGKNSYFTGLMKCGNCGCGVSYTNSHGTQGYYICSNRKNRGWNSCPVPAASKKRYDPIILNAILLHYADPAIRESLEQAKAEHKQPLTPKEQLRKNTIQQRLAVIDGELQNLVSSIAQSGATMIKYLNAKIEELDAEKTVLLQELHEIEQQGFFEDSRMVILLRIYDILDAIPGILAGSDFEDIRNTCELLVKNVIFMVDGSVEVSYTI